jgi:hypothetical protein
LGGGTFWNNSHKCLLLEPAQGRDFETVITRKMVTKLQECFKNEPVVDGATVNAIVTNNDSSYGYIFLEGGNVTTGEEANSSKASRFNVAIGLNKRLLAFVEVGTIPVEQNLSRYKRRSIDKLFCKKLGQANEYLQCVWDNSIEDDHTVVLEVSDFILFSILVFDKDKTIGRMAIFTAEPKKQNQGKF